MFRGMSRQENTEYSLRRDTYLIPYQRLTLGARLRIYPGTVRPARGVAGSWIDLDPCLDFPLLDLTIPIEPLPIDPPGLRRDPRDDPADPPPRPREVAGRDIPDTLDRLARPAIQVERNFFNEFIEVVDGRQETNVAGNKRVVKDVVKPESTVNELFGVYPKTKLPSMLRKNLHLSQTPTRFPYNQCVGLEIEVEGVRTGDTKPELNIVVNEGFHSKPDGSLRNGTEFVTMLGLTAGDAISYVSALDKLFDAGRGGRKDLNTFGFRCGLHAHIDVTTHTLEELYRAFLVYTVVEPLLFPISGGRNKNKFCVAVHDCASVVEELIYYGRNRNWIEFAKALRRGSKYMAMNVRTVTNFGTIEFRHHEGTSNPERIKNWLLVLCDIVVGSKDADTNKLEKEILELNTVSSYSKFLSVHFPNSEQLLRSVKAFERVMYPGSTFVKQTFITEPDRNDGLTLERD